MADDITEEMVEGLCEKTGNEYGHSAVIEEDSSITLDNLCLEFISSGSGDFRQSPVEIRLADGSYSNRFYYQSAEIYDGIYKNTETTGLPHARVGNHGEITTLEVTLVDEKHQLELIIIYTSFEKTDIITKRCILKNNSEQTIEIEKLMSLQLDLPESQYQLVTFDGLWARERHLNRRPLVSGLIVNDSTTGNSSNRHNPFIMLEKEGCQEDSGDCLGVNLIYSGNHYEGIEVSEYQKVRILAGINPHRFLWCLEPTMMFTTPEAIMSFSSKGRNGLSQQLHTFVQQHIISPQWIKRERPILINNWEATYFDFTEQKLLKLAKEAKEIGIELFVLDDGWFGERNDDTSSLGDWVVNEKKLGGSLSHFAEKINQLGLQFGLWLEPEMIIENSN